MMTNEEIKKGLELCKANWCVMCPYSNCIGCEGLLKQDALTLITEQEKEIAQLKEKVEELRNEKWDAQDDLDCYYEEQNAEIKQLKETVEKLRNDIYELIKEYEK